MCKVVQYCSEQCQKEHWKMVHKKQCKMLAFVKDNGSDDLPTVEAPDDTMEILKSLMQKTSSKLFSIGNISADPMAHHSLTKLWKDMKESAELTWCAKWIFPKEDPLLANLAFVDFRELYGNTRQHKTRRMRSADQDLWSTLHLVWGRLQDCTAVAQLNSLKEPQNALSKELWTGLQEEVGVFPVRVAEVIQAFSGDEVPSFKSLLEIICGGTLAQKCSFCDASMTVTAVAGEGEGCYQSSTPVALLPHMAPMFSCGHGNCAAQMQDKLVAHGKWKVGVCATVEKLRSASRCDYCFKLSEKVHRCSKCLTKSWCSRECQQKDWYEKHNEFCNKDADQRKVRGGAQVRIETAMKSLEEVLENNMMLNKDKPMVVQNAMSGVKKLCEKKVRKSKTATKVQANSNDGAQQK